MINQWTVLNLLKQIAALDGEPPVLLLPVCLLCLEEIRGRLRDAKDENDARVSAAAAGLAFYRLALKRITEDGAAISFKAGDVQITGSPAELLAAAAKVRDESLAAAAPLLRDDLFFFGGVEV